MIKRYLHNKRVKNAQMMCLHEYYVVSDEGYDDFYVDEYDFIVIKVYDIYCPKCSKMLTELTKEQVARQLGKQQIRNNYYREDCFK